MATLYIKCCNKLHEVIQFTTMGPMQYGAECSVCGKRVAAETPEDVGWKWEKMKASKPLDAGLAERLWKIWYENTYGQKPEFSMHLSHQSGMGFEELADEVRKIVKEATNKGEWK